MGNLIGFDASQVPEQQDFSALPEGKYVVIATASEMKPTKAGTGQFLQFTFEVLDGQYKGRKLWARLNLVNPNQTAVDIAQRELAAICRAVGVLKPSDSAELHNKPMLVTVGVELDDRKRESNIIKKYEAISPGFTGAAPVASSGAPWHSTAQQAVPAAATTAAPGTPPWAR